MSIGNKNVGELCSSLGKSSCAHKPYLTHPFPCIRDILWLQRPLPCTGLLENTPYVAGITLLVCYIAEENTNHSLR